MSNNQSVRDALRSAVHGLSDRLDTKEYRTTDGVRHPLDYRIVILKDGAVAGDLCSVDRQFYDNKRTNKAEREERDEFVLRTINGIKLRPKR